MDIDILETTALNIENLSISSNSRSSSAPSTSSSQQTTQARFFSSPLLEPPSPQSDSLSSFGSQSPPPQSPPQVIGTEFLQIVSVKMKHGSFPLQELFLAFPLAVRIWSGVSSVGGAAARLDFKSASIAASVLRKHGKHGQSQELGEYHLCAELEDEEDEWWKTQGTQTWQSIRYFWGTESRP